MENLGDAMSPMYNFCRSHCHNGSRGSCEPLPISSKCDQSAEESYLDCLYTTAWEDELLLQVSQAFLKEREEEEEEDSLLLTASQDYKKRCGSLMGFQHQFCGPASCINILTDAHLVDLNSEMWRLCGQGFGTKLKKAEPVTRVMKMRCGKKVFWVTRHKQIKTEAEALFRLAGNCYDITT